jgi:bifunctional non-homologous end joining protein LigD
VSTVKVGAHTIELSHPDKVLFPADGITKAELVEYYRQVGPAMLRHLRDRPLILQRYPNGIHTAGFIQQQIPEYFPDWIPRVTVPKQRGTVTHVVCNNLASLVYLASQACITVHTWLSRADKIEYPDQMIFDLDPARDDFDEVRSCALELHELLDELGLPNFVKTTGSRGAHIVVPLDRRANFDEVRAFAREVAEELVKRDPQHRTTQPRKEQRGGRLFVDIMRNAYGQTAVAPYSVRALPAAPVAAPLVWRELERGDVGPRTFTIRNIRDYVREHGDPWKGLARRARSLRAAHGRLVS